MWKTALAVALAERLARAGQRVLLLSTEPREEARARLGVRHSDPPIASRAIGPSGCVTVVGLHASRAVALLYRVGPEPLGLGPFDLAVVDTPSEVSSGSMPGVLLIVPTDGADADRNAAPLLARAPASTQVILVHAGREDPEPWAHRVDSLERACGRPLEYLREPVPRSERIAEAHNAGQSVWTLPRQGPVRAFLEAVETLATLAYSRIPEAGVWTEPPPVTEPVYVPGWGEAP